MVATECPAFFTRQALAALLLRANLNVLSWVEGETTIGVVCNLPP